MIAIFTPDALDIAARRAGLTRAEFLAHLVAEVESRCADAAYVFPPKDADAA